MSKPERSGEALRDFEKQNPSFFIARVLAALGFASEAQVRGSNEDCALLVKQPQGRTDIPNQGTTRLSLWLLAIEGRELSSEKQNLGIGGVRHTAGT